MNKLATLPRTQRERIITGAVRYAQSDRSDPFAFRRAITHAEIGLSSIHKDKNGQTVDHFYDAEKVIETRKIVKQDGTTESYPVEVYHNAKRP